MLTNFGPRPAELHRAHLNFVRVLTFLLLLTSALAVSAFAQSESGSAAIEGTITDANGAVIAGATVTVRNLETGLQRTATADARGGFSVPVLPVGRYEIKAQASGFAEAKLSEVHLAVGQATPVNFKLGAAGVNEQMTVSGGAETINAEESATGLMIPQRAVQDLPIRGRNFVEFVQLTPAVLQEFDRKGLIISGQRSINSNVSVDGADYNDPLQGNQRGGNDGVFFFPQTAIREFQVVRSGANAEIGRTSAGFVNVVTKSGTNDFHGEGFYFNRNRALTSPDAFGFKGNNQQNQFGGSIGGPIKRDRAFFFVGVEQNFLQIPYQVRFDPQPAGVTLPSSILALQGAQNATNNPTAIFARADFNLNSNTTLNVQYTYSRLRGENFNSSTDGSGSSLTDAAATSNFVRIGSSNAFKASLISVLSPQVVNEFRAQIATDYRNENPNQAAPELDVAGVGTLGGNKGWPRLFDAKRSQLADNLSYNVGAHRLRFGFDGNINTFAQQREGTIQPRFNFVSLSDYLLGRPSRYRQTFPALSADAMTFRGTGQELAFFAQDRISLSRTLTLTAGFRWEGQWNPQPQHPNPAIPQTTLIPNDLKMWQPRLGLAWDVRGNGKTVVRLSAGLFDARTPANLFQRVTTDNGLVSLAVDIKEDKNCLDGTKPQNCLLSGGTAAKPATAPVLIYPNVLASVPTTAKFTASQQIFGFQPNFRNPRSFQTAATLERSFGRDWALSLGYIHNSTWNLQRRVDRNLFPAVTSVTDPAIGNDPTLIAFFNAGLPIFPKTRPNPTYGILSFNESSAHSSYNGMTVSLTRQLSRRAQMQLNYTLANNRDDDSNERNFSRETDLNPFNLKLDAGPSKQDVRHSFNISGLYDLGHGFTVSGIIVTRSGFPYTAVVNTDFQNDSNDVNDLAVINGVLAKRNGLRMPHFFDLDLRVIKAFRLSETKQINISLEGFNLTRNGNKNFGSDSVSIYGTPLAPDPNAGVPTNAPSTARFGGPRQLQLGARFVF